jgi:cell division protein FtsB
VNDLFPEAKTVFMWLLGVVMALLAWIGKRQIRRIDDLERQSVTREELSQTLKQMREDRLQMHRENREELRYIRDRVDGIADRQ